MIERANARSVDSRSDPTIGLASTPTTASLSGHRDVDATALRALIRDGHVTPADAVRHHLRRIWIWDEEIESLRSVFSYVDRADRGGPDDRRGDLRGVPVVVKENLAVRGGDLGQGLPDGLLGDEQHPCATALEAAGATIIGRGAMPELGIFPLGDARSGATRNPRRPHETAGGSSGGVAAAVAAGFAPLGVGNDGMGSIRLPAAICGVVGLRPSPGMIATPFLNQEDPWNGMAQNGPIATSVRDVALLLDVLTGTPFTSRVNPSLRIGTCIDSPIPGASASTAQLVAVRTAAQALRETGHEVVELGRHPYPRWLGPLVSATWAACGHQATMAAGMPRELPGNVRLLAALGSSIRRFSDAMDRRARLWRTIADQNIFSQVDVLLTPAIAGAVPAARRWCDVHPVRSLMTSTYSAFASPWSIAGFPGMAVPVGHPDPAAPQGVQLVGTTASDQALIEVASAVERAAPWTLTAGKSAQGPGVLAIGPRTHECRS